MRIHLLTCLACVLLPIKSSFAAAPSIKVRIGKALQKVTVQGMDVKGIVFSPGKEQVLEYPGSKTLNFLCSNLTRKGKQALSPLATLSSPTGMLSWDGKKYRGHFDVVPASSNKSCDLVHSITMDDYISTLLAKEMNSKWPLEALKAQAVAARTYALHKMRTQVVLKQMGMPATYDLENSEKHQVNGSFMDVTQSTNEASSKTKGEVLLDKKGKLNAIFYHSKCGGKTFLPGEIWDNQIDGYQSVPCLFCQKHGGGEWEYKMPVGGLRNLVLKILQRVKKVDTANKDKLILSADQKGGPLLKVHLDGQDLEVNKSYIRRFLGREKLPSNNFKISKVDNYIVMQGEGNGHGVGMCQFGALELARRGWDYKRILSYYFPDYTLSKAY